MDITYSEVIVRDTNGFAVRQTGGSFTVDAGASGSALNSRDQSGAFSASQFLHFYAIYGSGQTTGGLVSLTAPTTVTGPTLPSNYTHWAYLFSVYWDASSHLLAVHVRGDEVFYDAQQVALLNGTATTETAVSLTTFVPASAVSFTFTGQSFGATTTAGGALNTFVSLRAVSGTDFTQTLLAGTFGATAAIRVPIGDITMPNHNQQFYYLSTAGTGTSPVASFFLNSYRVPNGGI